jgi:hypothetical protein
MLFERKQLPELYQIRHRHDDEKNFVDYEKKILNNSLSPYIYNNKMMAKFLDNIQPLVSLLFDKMNIVKNFKNYTVDKYYYKHNS